MAEIPRDLFGATTAEGEPLAPGAKAILAYLWSFVDAAEAETYKKRKKPSKAPRVVCDPEEIARIFHVDVDSVGRHITALRGAGYMLHAPDDPANTFALLDQAHRDEYLRVRGG